MIYQVETTEEEDEALRFLAEEARQDAEGVIEGLFAMIVEAHSGRPRGLKQ